MAQDRRRGGRPLIVGGVLLAAASLVVLVIVEPGADRADATVRLGAVCGFVGGVVIAVSGALPAREGPSVWRSRWYGVLLVLIGLVNLLAGWLGDAERGWLSAAVGIAALAGGIGVLVAARRRARPESSL